MHCSPLKRQRKNERKSIELFFGMSVTTPVSNATLALSSTPFVAPGSAFVGCPEDCVPMALVRIDDATAAGGARFELRPLARAAVAATTASPLLSDTKIPDELADVDVQFDDDDDSAFFNNA